LPPPDGGRGCFDFGVSSCSIIQYSISLYECFFLVLVCLCTDSDVANSIGVINPCFPDTKGLPRTASLVGRETRENANVAESSSVEIDEIDKFSAL